jgi:hypothetical protein
MSLEGAQASLKDREHGLRFFRGLTFVDRGLNDDALPGDAFLSCGNVPISLGKMLAFSIGVHVSGGPLRPLKSFRHSHGAVDHNGRGLSF